MNELKQWVMKHGLWAGLAVFLVLKLSGGFDVIDKRLQAVESQHSMMFTVMERNQRLTESTDENNRRILAVLRTMCVNDAKSTEARRLCLEER